MALLNLIKNKLLFPLGILLVGVIVFAANYSPGTYLVGWDNIMPEFNTKLNIARAFNSVWQDYRGLGTIDGLSHAANLTHACYVYLLSLVFPQNMLRYLFILSTWILGGLGFYLLILKLTRQKAFAFLGSLFYMLNLGVIQMYHAPLEVFAVHFAALPLVTYFILGFFDKPKIKSLAFVALISFFTSTQGFVPTVFIVYTILIFSLCLFYWLKTYKTTVVLILLITLFATNAFWALPFTYNAVFNGKNIQNTRINEFSSEEIYLRNKARGTLPDVLTFKGFMIDTVEYDSKKNTNDFLMQAWRKHISTTPYAILSLLFGLTVLLGIFQIMKNRYYFVYPFVLTFATSFVFLANNTPAISWVNELIRFVFPLFGEVFRFPFTKFVTLFAFSSAILFVYGLIAFRSWLPKYKEIALLIFTLTFAAILYSALPAFSGNFISPSLRNKIPKEYLSTFSYFNEQDKNARIAFMPMYTFWNWQFTDWSHKGSGFLWYGLEQPILLRAFDPWSDKNAQSYNEFYSALTQENIETFDNAIEKFDIGYILLDEHIINTLSPKPINYDQLVKFLDTSFLLKKDKQFGKIIIYKTVKKPSQVYLLPKSQTVKANSEYIDGYTDDNSRLLGNYVQDEKSPDIINIFPSLSTQKLQKDLEFRVSSKKEYIELASEIELPKDLKEYDLVIPSLLEESIIPIEIVIENGQALITLSYPKVFINNKELTYHPVGISTQLANGFTPTKVTDQFLGNDKPIKNGKISTYVFKGVLNVISLKDNNSTQAIEINSNRFDSKPIISKLPADTKDISVRIPKTKSLVNDSLNSIQWEFPKSTSVLNPFLNQQYSKHVVKANSVELVARSTISEAAFFNENLFHQTSYIMTADVKNISGLPVNFYLDSPYERRSVIDTRLSNNRLNTVIIPFGGTSFQGYGFHFIVKSVGTEIAEAKISNIEFYPITSETIENIKLFKRKSPVFQQTNPHKIQIESSKVTSGRYILTTKLQPGYIVISEAFDPGWKAYEIVNGKWSMVNGLKQAFPFWFGRELKDHVLVNNWENGWRVNPTMKQSNNSTIVILFLPQYLEYIGFVLLGGLIVGMIIRGAKNAVKKQKNLL